MGSTHWSVSVKKEIMGKSKQRSKRVCQTTRTVSSSSSASTSSTTSTDSSDTNTSQSTKRLRRKLKNLQNRLNVVENRATINVGGQVGQGEEYVIPVFDPQRSDQSIVTWTRRVDELARTYKWNDVTTVKLVANRLRGMARRWYDTQDQLRVSWTEMKTLLEKQFKKPMPFSKLFKNAALYEARPGQDLSEYCFNKLEKLKSLNLIIPEQSQIDAVIGGITDEHIARTARASRFEDTSELYAYRSTIGRMPEIVRGDMTTTKRNNFQPENVPVASTSGNKKLECYNCKGAHYFRQCPKPKLECTKCHSIGHVQKNCPKKK